MNPHIKLIEMEPQNALAIREVVPVAQIPTKMGQFFSELMAHFQKSGIRMLGPPFALYHDFAPDKIDMEVGFPVATPQPGDQRVKPLVLPGGKVVTAVHIGPYDKIEKTYDEMRGWMSRNGLRPKKMMWERYLSDPQTVKNPEEYVTELYWPVE